MIAGSWSGGGMAPALAGLPALQRFSGRAGPEPLLLLRSLLGRGSTGGASGGAPLRRRVRGRADRLDGARRATRCHPRPARPQISGLRVAKFGRVAKLSFVRLRPVGACRDLDYLGGAG